jgi:hypothetical protein
MAASTIADQLKRHSSQGSKVVSCVACHGDIQPFAGRPVSLIGMQYAHHPGQCAGADERASQVRDKAVQGELSAWSCTHVEPGSVNPVICDELGTDRDEYVRHMAGHGLKPISTPAPIRLRRKAPAAKLPKPIVNPFKFLHWTENGTERRGQYWADGPDPQSVWVVPLQPAPWEIPGRPAKPVCLYSHGDGSWSMDWSRAKYDRRDASRRAKRNAA